MELELGLKITRTRDDIASSSDLRISKDSSGPLFVSRETDAMFILIAHLKDYRGDYIDIKISEDGSRMVITGVKPIEEMVLKRWIMWKKNLELKTFRKVFRVPDGVVLDKIKARFKEEDSILTITMPKLVRGIVGIALEEVKEKEETDRDTQQTSSNIVLELETTSLEESKEAERAMETRPEVAQTTAGERPEEESDWGQTPATESVPQEIPERVGEKMVEDTSRETQELEAKESILEKVSFAPIALEPKEVQPVRETQKPEITLVEELQTEEIPELKEVTQEAETKAGPELSETGVEEQKANENSLIESNVVEEHEKQEAAETDREEQSENKEQVHEQETPQASEIQESMDKEGLTEEEERNENVNPEVEKQMHRSEGEIQEKKKKKPNLCPPLVFAGSAILVSLIVLVISLIRSKRR